MELEEKKVSIIRKYPLETLVIFLCVGLGFLTGWLYLLDHKLDDLQTEMKMFLQADRKELIESQNKNSSVIEKNTIIIENLSRQKK